ncbi:MAG: tetratricopeptide repeat protein [Deltaproteobacteria bacterium]|nr:tetratricopeptide repeat protein [Deltaproteobacteria bacterium]
MKLAVAAVVVTASLFSMGCPNQAVNDSKTSLAAGNKAIGKKEYDTAIVECKKAVEKWKENHSAHWCLGVAYAQRAEWPAAVEAFNSTVQYAPEQAMYQMWLGISQYEKAVQGAREEQARKENKKPQEVRPDLTAVNFEKPLQHLVEAVKLNDGMWRAHYNLGRVYREMDKPKEAAAAFSKAIAGNPREWAPYVALAELYRKWDYSDQAIKVAEQGAVNVVGQNEKSGIFYVLGMGYDDKRQDKQAIEAFTKALEASRDNHAAKFQRGQAYFRQNDYMNAKRDFEEFSKSGGASLEFAKQQASKMLMDIAVKTAPPGEAPTEKPSPEDMVKKGKK